MDDFDEYRRFHALTTEQALIERLSIVLTKQERFERAFGMSQWKSHLKKCIHSDLYIKQFLTTTANGEQVTLKMKIARAKSSKDLRCIIDTLTVK